ncbi:MAG: Gfo/Idh/MocA family protein [bacterium]
MDKVRLGMIGCGWGSNDLYRPFFKHLENGELVAVMDIDESRAKKYQESSGAKKVYTDLDRMLEDKDIDAVMILTPPNIHAEQVVKSAQAGKHIYCEKPMCKTIEEADRMIAACKENNVKLQIAFMKRFNKSFLMVKRVIDEGRLGDLFEMRAVWDNARPGASSANYRHRVETGGGYLQEDGSHPLDVCHWWMGDVVEVSGDVIIVDTERVENEDVGIVTMKHKNGGFSSLHITMRTHRTGEESYEVFGTKGTLLMRWLYHSTHSMEPAIVKIYEKSRTTTDLTLPTSWNPENEIITNWQYLNEMRHFCDCIINDKEPAVTGEDGRAVVEIVNAAYLSSWKGIKVKLPLEKSPDFEQFFRGLRSSSRWKIDDSGWKWRY